MIWIIIALIAGHQIILFVRRKEFDAFSPETIMDLVLLLIFVFPAVVIEHYATLYETEVSFLIMIVLGIISLYVGFHLPKRVEPILWKEQDVVTPKWLWASLIAFLVLVVYIVRADMAGFRITDFWSYFSAEKTLLLSEGIEATFYQSQVGASAWSYALIQLVWVGAMMLVAFEIHKRRWMRVICLLMLLFAGSLIIFKTRTILVLTIFLPVAYYHYRVKPLSLFAVPLGVIVFVVLLTILDWWRAAGFSAVLGGRISIEILTTGFEGTLAHIIALEYLWRMFSDGALQLEYGLNYLYGLLTFIPRFLWESKPLVAFANRWNYYILEGDLRGGGVWIFTAWGEGLAQFGYFGVVLNLFLFGYLLSLTHLKIRQSNLLTLVRYYYVVLGTIFLRDGFQALFVLTVIYLTAIYLFGQLSVKKARSTKTAHLSAKQCLK